MTFRLALRPLKWTSRPFAPAGYCNGASCNIGSSRGEAWPDRGFRITRLAADATAKACSSFLHKHTDGTEWPFYMVDTGIFPETGSDSPSGIASGLTATYCPSVVSMPDPAGASILLNGTNAQARLLRVVSGALATALLDFAAPGAVTLGTAGTGGSLSDGTYYVLVTWRDETGATVVETGPNTVQSITLTGGGAAQTITVTEPASAPARATHFSIWVGTSNAATAFFRQATAAVTSGTQSITAPLDTSDVIASRNGAYRTAVMPITGARWSAVHDGRMFVASETGNEVAFSERNAPNHWYATNVVSNSAESQWSDPVTALASHNGSVVVFTSKSIHRIVGTFTRDDQGDAPTYALDARPVLNTGHIGCVGHATIVQWLGATYFMSAQGVAALDGNSPVLLAPEDIQWALDEMDFTYARRWTAALDPIQGYYVVGVTRYVNTSRAMDGASVAGVCDLALRWDTRHGHYATPLRFGDFTHLRTREDGGRNVTTYRQYLCAMTPSGRATRLGSTWNGGGGLDVSATTFDGKLATANTTTSAGVTQAGITDGALKGQTVLLYYPIDDTGYPGVWVLRTITGNTTSGSTLTVTWAGALTVPSSTKWTVRIAGLPWCADVRIDPRQYVGDLPPGSRVRIMGVRADLQHVVGAESVS